MTTKAMVYIDSQIKVTAFIQGVPKSYCFYKSRVNLKSPQFISKREFYSTKKVAQQLSSPGQENLIN